MTVRMRTIVSGSAAALLLSGTLGAATAGPATAQSVFDHGHGTWARVLERHARPDGVFYADLAEDPSTLEAYVAELAAVTSSQFDGWTRDRQFAYLVNAYNALVIATVVEHYPITRRLAVTTLFRPADSVWQIKGFFDGVRHRVAGRELTLDDIEHAWLRPRYEDPRVHYALVCAACSCPPLRTEPYVAARLDAQLDEQAAAFLNDEAKNQFDRQAGQVRLSAIFEWFGEDFRSLAPAEGYRGSDVERGVLHHASAYLPDATARWLRDGAYQIEYLDYDWDLNDLSGR